MLNIFKKKTQEEIDKELLVKYKNTIIYSSLSINKDYVYYNSKKYKKERIIAGKDELLMGSGVTLHAVIYRLKLEKEITKDEYLTIIKNYIK